MYIQTKNNEKQTTQTNTPSPKQTANKQIRLLITYLFVKFFKNVYCFLYEIYGGGE